MNDIYSIRKKLENYKNIKQITEAMKLAAITGYSQCSKKTALVKNYLKKLNTTAAKLVQLLELNTDTSLLETPLFYSNRQAKSSLVILIGPSKNKASSFSHKLKSFIPKIIKPNEAAPTDFILIGKDANKLLENQPFDKNYYKIIQSITNVNLHQAHIISNNLSQFIAKNHTSYKKCTIINMRFKSFFIQEKNGKILYPIAENSDIKRELETLTYNKEEPSYRLEQNNTFIAEALGQKLCNINILYEIIESLTAEHATRFVSMDKAATNADKYITETTLQMNKARQVLITKQITEISCYTDL